MAASALLVDTDVLIDYLKGVRPAVLLLDSSEFDFYYSSWTRKELLTKPGLRESERQEIEALLRRLRILKVDDAIAEKYWILLKRYESRGLRQADALIAATAWQKAFPLLTRDQRHFGFIVEIELAPAYSVE
ncbi:MAG: PIN domain-containing protein [Pyrinomonadaceae bacterium]